MSGLIPILARVASSGAIKKIATRVVAGITGAGAKSVAPVYRNMQTGSVKVISRGEKQYPDDLDKLRQMTRPRASAPIESVGRRSRNAIKINSNPKRGN